MKARVVVSAAMAVLTVSAAAGHTNTTTTTANVGATEDPGRVRCISFVVKSGDGDSRQYPHGQVKSFVRSFQASNPAEPCDRRWERPKAWLSSHVVLWKVRGNSWARCRSYFGIWHSREEGNAFDWQYTFSRVPCGPGIYAVSGRASVKTRSAGWESTPWIDTAGHYWS